MTLKAETDTDTHALTVEQIAAIEHDLAAGAQARYGCLWTASCEAADLYERFAEAVELVYPEEQLVLDQIKAGVAVTLFMRVAGRTAKLEILDAIRQHIPETHMKHRRVLDLFAYAWICWSQPKAAEVWLEAGRGDEQRAKYKQIFDNSKIGGALTALSPRARMAYEQLSARTHPDVTSVSPGVLAPENPGARDIRVGCFDGAEFRSTGLGDAWIAEVLLDCAKMHIDLLGILASRAFKPKLWKSARKNFKEHREAADASFARAEDEWSNRIAEFESQRAAEHARRKQARPERVTDQAAV